MAKLSEFFLGVAIKRLSVVETDQSRSNQHEFNGAKSIIKIFGIPEGKVRINCQWIYFGENEEDTYNAESQITWYDAREAHENRTEFRLYYPENEVISQATAGDLLIIGKRANDSCLVIICKKGSNYESQLLWLFGVKDLEAKEEFITKEVQKDTTIGFAERQILGVIGIEVDVVQESWLELLIASFDNSFPTTRIFSEFARNNFEDVDSRSDPDEALINWINHEEILFKTFETHIVGNRIKEGFENVDSFVEFSLSVQNRRKSRMGHALENHLEKIFIDNKIQYSRNKITENNSKPDFLFPGILHYKDLNYSDNLLRMLAVKSSCKDRWRQILAEASRIKRKHLFTLEPGISKNQTDEMIINNVQLTIPKYIFNTYSIMQQKNIISLKDFIKLVGK